MSMALIITAIVLWLCYKYTDIRLQPPKGDK